MVDKIKTFWEKYIVQIITVLVIAIGFYFTTTTQLESQREMLINHELRLKVVELENAKTGAILERVEIRMGIIDTKLDKLMEFRGLK